MRIPRTLSWVTPPKRQAKSAIGMVTKTPRMNRISPIGKPTVIIFITASLRVMTAPPPTMQAMPLRGLDDGAVVVTLARPGRAGAGFRGAGCKDRWR